MMNVLNHKSSVVGPRSNFAIGRPDNRLGGWSYCANLPRLCWQTACGSLLICGTSTFIDCEGVELIKSLTDRGVRQVNAPPFVTEQILEVRGWTGD